jgi:cell wall-associated NlpC family hydrolase
VTWRRSSRLSRSSSAAALALTVAIAGPAAAALGNDTTSVGSGAGNPATIQASADAAFRRAVARVSSDVARLETKLATAQHRLQALHVNAEQAVEAYNAATARLSADEDAYGRAVAEHAQTARDASDARIDVALWASAVYRSGGPMSTWSTVLSAHGVADLLHRSAALRFVGDAMDDLLTRADQAEADAALAEQEAADALLAVQAETRAVAVARAAVQDRVVAALDRVKLISRQRTALLEDLAVARRSSRAAELARLASAETDRARFLAEGALRPAAVSGVAQPVAETDPGATAAVAFAIAQIGKPYVWAATGPGSFDCSGLTMRAWERGGAALEHYSAAQFREARPVDLADLRAGDLIFYAADLEKAASIYHVGIYVGGQTMVEAPHTGATVRRASIWRAGLYGLPARGPPSGAKAGNGGAAVLWARA